MTSLVRSLMTALLPLCAITGCLIGDGDDTDCTGGKCDGGGGGVCTDPRYGDGTCNAQIDCAAPDIDCFETFENDEAAATWFSKFENLAAMQEGRAPRTMLTASDPRFKRSRELLDKGWEAFRKNRPVGDLRSIRPALVLLDDDAVNAFVAPDLDNGNAGFAVMVQTGLLTTAAPDDGAIGVMMHEFQHVIGLHVVGDTKDRLRRFYIAPAGSEPIGKTTVDDAMARKYGEAWRAGADEVGPFVDVELGGLSFSGQIDLIFKFVLTKGMESNPSGCTSPQAQYTALRGDILDSRDPITGAITLGRASLPGRIQATLAALRNDCLAGFTDDFIKVVAAFAGTTPEMIEGSMSAEDKALVKGKHIIDGISALAADRRASMRATEAELASATGRPWSALRYFSYEEDADDVSVPVLRAAKYQPDGLGTFFVSFLPGASRTQCETMLGSGTVPPYGLDLQDEHHSTCWRAHHIRQVADSTAKSLTRPVRGPIDEHRRLPIPRPLEDRLAY